MKRFGFWRCEAHVTDMTQGNPVRLILTFALPMFLGNIFQQAYNMVDTMVAGYNLGDGAIAAIGASSSLYLLLINFAEGLNRGYAVIVTQRFGAGERKEFREAVAGMMVLDFAGGALLTALAIAFMQPLLRFLHLPDAIFVEAYSYIFTICAGITATMAYVLFASILRAMGNSRTPLFFLILASVLNIALDLVFIAVLRMGVAGAALATVIAQAISALLSGIYAFRHYPDFLPGKEDFRVPARTLAKLLVSGIAMALTMCVIDLGSVFFQRATNGLGEATIAAYTATRRIFAIMMQPLATIEAAFAIFVGQNWGAGKYGRIRSGMKRAMAMEIGWGLFSCALVLGLGGALVRFTTGTADEGIIGSAVMSLRWHFAFIPALGCLICLRSAMQAMGRKLAPMLSSGMELGIKLFAAAVLIPQLGFLGTSMAEPLAWCIELAFLVAVYLLGKRMSVQAEA